jgi:hypothetical protein
MMNERVKVGEAVICILVFPESVLYSKWLGVTTAIYSGWMHNWTACYILPQIHFREPNSKSV